MVSPAATNSNPAALRPPLLITYHSSLSWLPLHKGAFFLTSTSPVFPVFRPCPTRATARVAPTGIPKKRRRGDPCGRPFLPASDRVRQGALRNPCVGAIHESPVCRSKVSEGSRKQKVKPLNTGSFVASLLRMTAIFSLFRMTDF